MKKLVDDGWMRTDTCSQSSDEMLVIGNELAEALGKFTESFLPHMKEEEEVGNFYYAQLKFIGRTENFGSFIVATVN